MSLSELFANLKRYDRHAAIIFDEEEPIGRATDLVLPRRRWFRRREPRNRSLMAKPDFKSS
jgi:hypothetical protein